MSALTVCNHEVMTPSKTLGKLMAKCGMCGRRKKWPFAKMVKCCQCKKLWHAKCLPPQTHSSHAVENNARTERQPRTQRDSCHSAHGSLCAEDVTMSLRVNLRMRGKDYTLLPVSNPIRLLPQRESRHNQRQEKKSENSEDFQESKKKISSESDHCTIGRFHVNVTMSLRVDRDMRDDESDNENENMLLSTSEPDQVLSQRDHSKFLLSQTRSLPEVETSVTVETQSKLQGECVKDVLRVPRKISRNESHHCALDSLHADVATSSHVDHGLCGSDSNENSLPLSQASDPDRFLSIRDSLPLDQIIKTEPLYFSDSDLPIPVYRTKNSYEQERIHLIAGGSNNNVRPSEHNTRTISPSPTLPKMSMSDFTLLKLLGRGKFGEVLLCQHKTSSKYFAIKALQKYKIVLSPLRVTYLNTEKRVFQIATQNRHPFLTNMFCCFQTNTHVCFVMEYAPGGDLTTHLIRHKAFDEPTAVFYAACMALGLQYLHEKRIIYRDMKLLNVLMDAQGYVKIADFGFCKEGIGYGERTNTFCGTTLYMAPEMIRQFSYTRSVDWWGFGIVIFEMLIGDTPFERFYIRSELYDAIASGDIYYPDRFSSEALSILKGLLNKKPDDRLGSSERDAEDVKEHPFFKQIVWDDLLKRKVKPPYVPTFSSLEDVKYFTKEFTVQEPQLEMSITPMPLSSEKQDMFKNFSYTTADWFQQEE